MPLRLLLLATALCALASPASAGTKLDLSPYLAPPRMAGDFKVFAWNTGGTRTVTTLDVQPWAKGWAYLSESRLLGTPGGDSVSTYDSYLIPGKQLLSGGQVFEDFEIAVAKPSKGLRLAGSLGKVQRTKARALVLVGGQVAGAAARAGAWMADGFETIATPGGTWPNALRALSSSAVGIFDGIGETIFVYEETLWYAEGVGLVKAQTSVETWENGVLTDTQKWIEQLASGSLGGVPFP
jgi:hypothetical protein